MALLFATVGGDLLAALLFLVVCAVLYVRHKFQHWQQLGIPFVEPSFPFGNFGPTFMQRKSFGDRTVELYAQHRDQPFVGVWTGLLPLLMIRDPELMRSVLIRDFANFQDRGMYYDEKRDPLSAHLFAIGGEKWRHLRQKLSPTFTSGKLKAMFQTLVDCGEPLRKHLVVEADKGSVLEMRELLAQFTTNIIASVAFGLEIDCIADPDTSFRHYGRKVFEPTVWNSLRGAVAFFFPRLMAVLRLKAVDADVEKFFLSVVRQNMELREKGSETRKDFFQLLVQLRNTGLEEDGVWATKITGGDEAGKQLSVETCAAQSFVFYLAGFETSSTTVSYALYELARNPECQRRAQAEIDEVLARNGGVVSYDAVNEMKYLECCLDETLRKYPPVPLLNRVCSSSWTIPNSGGKVLPAGSSIAIPVYAIHHDPQFYPEPERFDPQRFSAEQNRSFTEQPYLPFGEGPRNCIGLRLGKMQSKVGLIVMLQKFSYELAGNTEKPLAMNPSSFLLAPIGGINLRVSHRK